jgi:hypothetical protein
MIKRIAVLALAVVAVAAVAVSGAEGKPAKAKRTLTINSTISAASVGTQGSQSVLAGTVTDPVIGHGAVVYLVSGGTTQTGTFTSFSTRGSIHGTLTVTVITNPDGTLSTSGKATVTGGSLAFKHATGTLTESGTIDKQNVVHAVVAGKIKY